MSESWAELFGTVSERSILFGITGVVVLILLLLLLRRRQPKKVVAYITDSGRVMVSRSAIVELVQTSCAQLEEVSKPAVKIKVKGNVTHFQVHLKLTSGGRLREIEQTLQSHLRNALTENLGIENLGKIDIVATGFKSGKIASSTTPLKAPETPTLTLEPEDHEEVEVVESVEKHDEPNSETTTDKSEPKLF